MPLVDLDDPGELRARWAALAAVAHACGRDRIWWADERGLHYEDSRGDDLRLITLADGRAVLFGFHYEESRTADEGAYADLLSGAPDWIGQPEVRHRIATGQLGFVYGHFAGTWARAEYPGDPWQPLEDGFSAVGSWLTDDRETEYEVAEQVLQWSGADLNADEVRFGAMGLIRAAGSTGIRPSDLDDFFALLRGARNRVRPDGTGPDLAAGAAAAAVFTLGFAGSRADAAAAAAPLAPPAARPPAVVTPPATGIPGQSPFQPSAQPPAQTPSVPPAGHVAARSDAPPVQQPPAAADSPFDDSAGGLEDQERSDDLFGLFPARDETDEPSEVQPGADRDEAGSQSRGRADDDRYAGLLEETAEFVPFPELADQAPGGPRATPTDRYPADSREDRYPAAGDAGPYPSDSAADTYPSDGAADSYPSGGASDGYPSGGAADGYPSGRAADAYPSGGAADSYPSGGAADSYPSDRYPSDGAEWSPFAGWTDQVDGAAGGSAGEAGGSAGRTERGGPAYPDSPSDRAGSERGKRGRENAGEGGRFTVLPGVGVPGLGMPGEMPDASLWALPSPDPDEPRQDVGAGVPGRQPEPTAEPVAGLNDVPDPPLVAPTDGPPYPATAGLSDPSTDVSSYPSTGRSAQPPTDEPAYPAADRPSYPANDQPSYATDQSAYLATDQPSSARTDQSAYPATEQPEYPATGQPSPPAADRPAYPTADQPAYPTAEQSAYPATEQPAYPGADQPGWTSTEWPSYAPAEQAGQLPAESPAYLAGEGSAQAFADTAGTTADAARTAADVAGERLGQAAARPVGGPHESLEEAMRAEPERPRPRIEPGQAFRDLHEWCRERTRMVPSGFTIHVYLANPQAVSYSFDLDPPEVPDARIGPDQIGGLLQALWREEADREHGGWMFARIDAAGRTLRVDRWYDSIPSWWAPPVADRAVSSEDVAGHLDGRGPRWQPSYAGRLELVSGSERPSPG